MKKVLLLAMLILVMGAGVMSASAQSLRVKGTITYQEDGAPVIGATVLVVGTDVVAISDIYGQYQITVPGPGMSIQASYVGLSAQVKPVSNNNEVIDFVLATDMLAIENVVVTGYGSARKVGTIVGSVEQVTSEDLENRPAASVMDALQGKVAGLQIYTSTGEPSETQSIRLHGIGSLYAGSSPLYVLDGIVVSQNTILAMNVNDFESVTVLKDASATSIYGSRAANGVIVYTTKRGKQGDAKINIRAQYGVSTQASTKFYDNMMSTEQLWQFGDDIGNSFYSETNVAKYTAAGYNTVDTDWFRYLQDEWSPTYQADFSVAGGSQNTVYYISAGLYSQDGAASGSYYDKMSFRVNVDSKVKDWMRIGANVQLLYDEYSEAFAFNSNYSNGGLAYLTNPMYPTYYMEESVNAQGETVWERGADYWEEIIPGYSWYNPDYVTESYPNQTSKYATSSSAYIELEPMKNLKIKSLAGLEFLYQDYYAYGYPSSTPAAGNGWMSTATAKYYTATITNTIEYAFDVKDDHKFTVLAGQEGIRYNYNYLAGSTSGLTDDDLMQLGFGDQSTYSVSSSDSDYAYLSFFGTANYSWKDKLYVDATVRNDQSSKFGPDNRAATFWALGAMFDFHKQFLADSDIISGLRGKVSYGTQGNSSIGNYEWQGLVGVTSAYNGETGTIPSSAANPDLQWETQTKLTIAASVQLWKRLNIDVEYYLRDTKDMLMEVPLSSTAGFDSVLKNVGGLRNEGIDFSIDYDILRSNDYWLNVSFNINYNKQTITELFDGRKSWNLSDYGFTYAVGDAVNFYFPVYAGVDTQTGKQLWYKPGEDYTKLSTAETTDEYNFDELYQNTGKALYAPIAGGFSLSGGWKGFSLQADFSYVLGKYMINNDLYFYANPNTFNYANQSVEALDYWKEPGDDTKYPDWAGGETLQFSTIMLENASFLRLKNLTFGYTFPRKWLQNQDVVSGFNLYVTGRNVFTITEYGGIDPEVDSNLAIGTLGNTKQFVVGFELTF